MNDPLLQPKNVFMPEKKPKFLKIHVDQNSYKDYKNIHLEREEGIMDFIRKYTRKSSICI